MDESAQGPQATPPPTLPPAPGPDQPPAEGGLVAPAAEPPLLPAPSSPWRPPPRPIEFSLKPWLRVLIPFLLFVGAFGFYQYDIDHPPIIVFDEAHYVKVARNYTNGIIFDNAWNPPRPQNFEHPPVAKYLIAAGIWLNGKPHNDWENQRYITQLCGHDNPECAPDAKGWRLASTVVGASGIVAAYLVGLRLFNRVTAGVFAALLLLMDGMYFLHSRLAMLDVFPVAFWLWGFAFALSPYRGGRILGALFLGLGISSKYSAMFLLPLFLLVVFFKTPVPRLPRIVPTDTVQGRALSAWEQAWPWIRRFGSALLIGLLLPLLVLVASYTPFFIEWYQRGGVAYAVKQWIFVEVEAFTWDFSNNATHPYSSKPWTWIPMLRPVFYYTIDLPNNMVGKQWSVGNPLLWWSGTLAAVAVVGRVLWRFFTERARHFMRFDFIDHLVYYPFWFTRDLSLLVGALFLFVTYLPWFIIQRVTFNFYMMVVIPSFAIIAAGLLSENWEKGGFPRLLSILYGILAVAVFAFYYPVVSGVPISRTQYDVIRSVLPWIGIL